MAADGRGPHVTGPNPAVSTERSRGCRPCRPLPHGLDICAGPPIVTGSRHPRRLPLAAPPSSRRPVGGIPSPNRLAPGHPYRGVVERVCAGERSVPDDRHLPAVRAQARPVVVRLDPPARRRLVPRRRLPLARVLCRTAAHGARRGRADGAAEPAASSRDGRRAARAEGDAGRGARVEGRGGPAGGQRAGREGRRRQRRATTRGQCAMTPLASETSSGRVRRPARADPPLESARISWAAPHRAHRRRGKSAMHLSARGARKASARDGRSASRPALPEMPAERVVRKRLGRA